jgi:hypothetical protein
LSPMATMASPHSVNHSIDLDRCTQEYVDTINAYRVRLKFLPLQRSDDLTRRAVDRANELAATDRIENSPPDQLLINNEPIGET